MKDFPLPLVRLFPTEFRVQFGHDMCEQIVRDTASARERGRIAALAFRISTALDLIRSALAERRDPAWTGNRLPSPNGQDRTSMLTSWFTDLRHSLYTLRRTPSFTAITIATLGLAIGVNVAIFSVVDAVLLKPLPYPNADRLVYIGASAPGSDFPDEFGVSNEFLVQYMERSQLLENVASFNSFTNTLRLEDRIERVRMAWPHWTFFHTLEVAPALGRLPQPADEDRVVVLAHSTWETWFGSDPDVIGRTVEISGADRTVIGVMGPEFWFQREDVYLWLSHVLDPEEINIGRFGSALIGRVAPGVDNETLANELNGLASQLPERFGGSARYAALIEQHRAVVRSAREALLGPIEQPLWILLGAVAIVLLIACGNVANLFMVRAEGRQRDLAVRRALGAGRGALVRTQLSEAFLIAAAAAVLAVILAVLGVPALIRAAPQGVPRMGDAGMSGLTLAFTAAAAAFTALACGLTPALRASSPRLTRLQESGRGSTARRHWGRDALVVGQTALALVLLIGSGLLLRSFWELRQVDPGYDIENIFTFQIAPDEDHLVDAATFARFHADFADRLAALPGVESVGMVENLPLNENVTLLPFITEDSPVEDEDAGTRLWMTWAAHDYFGTMGIDVLQGRAFTNTETAQVSGNVVISKTAADTLWPGQDPIGRQIRRSDLETWDTVIGVVEDVMQNSFRDEPMGLVYYSFVGQPGNERVIGSPAYVVKTERADSIGTEIRAAVREAAPTAPMYRVFTMEGLAANSMVDVSFTMITLGVASGLALILGAIGLFGVLSYVVSQRTREIGVRMALGARAAKVQRMVIRQGSMLLGVGVALGILVAAGVTRFLDSILFGVQPADLLTYVGMSMTMVIIGLLASYLPARRASRVDPIESLRIE